MNVPPSGVQELEQLAELYDEEFVVAAYALLLGRPPDVGGLKNYLAQVRVGVDKKQILIELAFSEEGRTRTPAPGLDYFIKKYSMRKPTALRRMIGPDQDQMLSFGRRLCALENHLYLAHRDLAKQLHAISDSIRLVETRLAAPIVLPPQTDDGKASASSGLQLLAAQLQPKLRKTFDELAKAISARR